MDGGFSKVEIAQLLLRLRALRWDYFRGDLFDEYAWNLLLVLYIADENARATTETMAVQEANVPPAVGKRWIAHLEQSGLIERGASSETVRLSGHSRTEMAEYCREVARALAT